VARAAPASTPGPWTQRQRCQQCNRTRFGYYIAPGREREPTNNSGNVIFKGNWLETSTRRSGLIARKVLTDFISRQSSTPHSGSASAWPTYDTQNVSSLDVFPATSTGLQNGPPTTVATLISSGMVAGLQA